MLPVERLIRDTIGAEGPIPFSRFMEIALYSPDGGYYRNASPVGAAGDYFTSPTAHPLFGTLLAAQLCQMWEALGRPDSFTVLEPGAGSGVMARDILEAVKADFPDFARAMRYVALDYAPAKPADVPDSVQWVTSDGLPVRGIVGCVLANELLDAMPVTRFAVKGGVAREVYVTLDGDGFVEVLGEPTSDARIVLEYFASLLPDGYRGEVCTKAHEWAMEAVRRIERGFVLIIDYGGTARWLYAPKRNGGTLRCHYRHVVTGNPYVRVGQQDMTAHVDFTNVKEFGEGAYNLPVVRAVGYTTQRRFLRNLGADVYIEALARRSRPQPSYRSGEMPRQEYLANRMAMQSLLAPEGLGGFRVLGLGKGGAGRDLWGFTRHNRRLADLRREVDSLRVPMLTPSHVLLMEGKYPHLAEPQGWQSWSGEEAR
ncbi:MAG: SAM-dependent methyltransferase [Chloroflexota bacterium]|nr:SAM-dependent methyltransferase [Chloroflexota bacterium]MDE2969772.1 SAM-dependent methyltransferase [Chloroflexota bacterium]